MVRGYLVASGAGILLMAATIGGVLGVAGAAPARHEAVKATHAAVHKAAVKHVKLALVILVKGPGAPKYTADGKSSKVIHLPAHAVVRVTLRSYDDGAAPPAPTYAKVRGTVGGVIRLHGKKVKSVALKTIAHTFTVPGIGLNVPVPALTGKAKYVTETFTFKTGKAGTYAWQCYAPCGTGSSGWGGPMVTPGQMMGTVKVG